MIKLKINILAELKAAGYSSAKIRKDKIFGERVVQQLRDNIVPSWAVINKLCLLLHCNVGDLVEYVPDDTHTRGVNED